MTSIITFNILVFLILVLIVIYDNLKELLKLIFISNYDVKELSSITLYYYGLLFGFGIVLMINSGII